MPFPISKPYTADNMSSVIGGDQRSREGTQRGLLLEEWKPVPFSGAYKNYGGTGFTTCQYTKDIFGFVHLRGVCANTDGNTTTTGTTMFTLPEGYRPAAIEGFCLVCGTSGVNTVGNFALNPTGTFQLASINGAALALPATIAYVWLGAVTFYANLPD